MKAGHDGGRRVCQRRSCARRRDSPQGPGSASLVQKLWLKKETHAARWGLLRGYSSKATKWVDFVMTDSTRRESCHSLKVKAKRIGVKRHLRICREPPNYWRNCRYPSLTNGFPPPGEVVAQEPITAPATLIWQPAPSPPRHPGVACCRGCRSIPAPEVCPALGTTFLRGGSAE
jgi:hypothetical protein